MFLYPKTLKRMFTAVSLIIFYTGASSQTLFTYGNKPVTQQEFLQAYLKNAQTDSLTESSLRDYLTLYIRYKLKVQSALDLKMDTLETQKAEQRNFRDQLIPVYMNDEAGVRLLTDEAYQRSKTDVHIAHIFVSVPESAGKELENAAYKRIFAAHKELLKGKSFSEVAMKYSEDPSVKSNGGKIGFITSLLLPYAMETQAYTLAKNKYSQPFRTKAGYHIIQNLGDRNAAGRMRVSQIMLAFPPDFNDEQKLLLRKKADSLHAVIMNGGDFASLAATFSDDNLSLQTGGEIAEFGVGQYDPVFEKAAFGLKNDGDVSNPIETTFGFHIIKRKSHRKVPEAENDMDWWNELKERILISDRMEIVKSKLVNDIQKTARFRKLPFKKEDLMIYTDSLIGGHPVSSVNDLRESSTLLEFGRSKVTVRDWQIFISETETPALLTNETFDKLFARFTSEQTLAHYKQNIKSYNPRFVQQLNEFKEGNLLFEIMQQQVWDAATNDTAGLKNHYEKNREKYVWEASADAVIITLLNGDSATIIRQKLKQNPKNYKAVLKEYENIAVMDSGRFELAQIPVRDRTNFTENLVTADVVNETDKVVTFAVILTLYPAGQPRSFDDARGFVINDYQLLLEEQWIDRLLKQYPVELNERVFRQLVDSTRKK